MRTSTTFKIFALSFIFIFLLTACNNMPVVALDEKPLDMSVQKTVGNFNNVDGRMASGKALIFGKDKAYQLVFEELMVNNAPDLRVYLSQELNPKNFIELGALKSIKGNQVYDVPSGVDAPSYKYALVYCKKFSQLYGYAALK